MISNMNETLKKFVLRLSQLFDSFRNCCNIMLPARLGTAVPGSLSSACHLAPVAEVAGRRLLRSASRGLLYYPPYTTGQTTADLRFRTPALTP